MLRNQIKIGNWTYKINPAIKKYALRDIKNYEDIYHEAQIAFDKLKKYVAVSK